jgi:hypothetical protein
MWTEWFQRSVWCDGYLVVATATAISLCGWWSAFFGVKSLLVGGRVGESEALVLAEE